jgi:hypothetical protein
VHRVPYPWQRHVCRLGLAPAAALGPNGGAGVP